MGKETGSERVATRVWILLRLSGTLYRTQLRVVLPRGEKAGGVYPPMPVPDELRVASVGLKSLVLPDFSVHSLNKLLWAQTLVGPQALSKVSGCRGQCLDGDSHGKQKLERTQRAVAGM